MNQTLPQGAAYYMRRVVDQSASMLAYWDRDLLCCFANRAYEVWFGVDPDKLIGESIRDLLGPKLFALNEPHIRAALQGKPQIFERAIPGPDGITRHSLATYIPDVINGEVVGFMVQVTEVTTLKETQAQLQTVIDSLAAEVDKRRTVEGHLLDVQQSLAVTLASIGAGFLATDRDGFVIRLNDVAQQLLGWTESEAYGRSVWEVVQREGRTPETTAMNPVDVMIQDGVTIQAKHDIVVISRNGTRVPMEVKAALTHSFDGAVRGLAMVFRDKTQMLRAEAERIQAEERFRLVVEANPSGILMVDRSHTITMANRKAEELLGYLRDEIIGQQATILFSSQRRAQYVADIDGFFAVPMVRAMANGHELFLRRKDGVEVAVEIELTPIETAQSVFMLAFIHDITERKRRELELRRSNAELEQFAYIASHDLQEPLRSVTSYTQLLRRRYGGKLDKRADEYINYAIDGAQRMHQLVTDLLAYSRVGSPGKPMLMVDTKLVLDSVLRMLAPSIRNVGASIQSGPLPIVMADDGQVFELFQNLVGNAIKFRGDKPIEIHIEATTQDDHVRFSVKDNGIGIDMQYRDRIFQMFQRLHERDKYEGSGIGLTIAKRIVERHGGQIWFESEVGVGTTFYFTLKTSTSPTTNVAFPR